MSHELSHLTITRAKDADGVEWVPARAYDDDRNHWEALRCYVVNPRRNVKRALRALEDGDMEKLRYFLNIADEQMDAAYEEAFPRD